MNRARTVITEGTLMPLSLVFTLLIAVFWTAAVYQRVLAAESAIQAEQTQREAVDTAIFNRITRSEALLNDTHAGVARVEGKVDVILREVRRQ